MVHPSSGDLDEIEVTGPNGEKLQKLYINDKLFFLGKDDQTDEELKQVKAIAERESGQA